MGTLMGLDPRHASGLLTKLRLDGRKTAKPISMMELFMGADWPIKSADHYCRKERAAVPMSPGRPDARGPLSASAGSLSL
jgi:hypothetical protein